MSEGDFYNIEKILDRRKTNGKYEYKIKWEGYPMSQSTWEPMKNLESAKELVEEYNRTHPINTQKKPSKGDHKKKDATFIHKKRKKENDDKIEQIPQNEKKVDSVIKLKDLRAIRGPLPCRWMRWRCRWRRRRRCGGSCP